MSNVLRSFINFVKILCEIVSLWDLVAVEKFVFLSLNIPKPLERETVSFDNSFRGACLDLSPPCRRIFELPRSSTQIGSCVHTHVGRKRAFILVEWRGQRGETDGDERTKRTNGGPRKGKRMRVMGARSHKTATTDIGSCSPSVPYSPCSLPVPLPPLPPHS